MTQRRLAVLVTGSREWTNELAIHLALLDATKGYLSRCVTLIHGDARGADTIAAEHARGRGMFPLAMPAQWTRDGKSAGHKRNAAMVRVLSALRDCGYECRVFAFPIGESRGTRNCMELAREAGFDVRVIEGSGDEQM